MEEIKHKQYAHHKELFAQVGIALDALTIHQKDFKMKFRGYDPYEVDTFLDEIIKDYSQFYVIISDLLGKYKKLKLQERANKVGTMQRGYEQSIIKEPSMEYIEDIIRRMEQSMSELKYRLMMVSSLQVKMGDDTNTV